MREGGCAQSGVRTRGHPVRRHHIQGTVLMGAEGCIEGIAGRPAQNDWRSVSEAASKAIKMPVFALARGLGQRRQRMAGLRRRQRPSCWQNQGLNSETVAYRQRAWWMFASAGIGAELVAVHHIRHPTP
jgi:hypothetical protein